MVMPAFGFLQIVFADYDGRCDLTLKSLYRLSLFFGVDAARASFHSPLHCML